MPATCPCALIAETADHCPPSPRLVMSYVCATAGSAENIANDAAMPSCRSAFCHRSLLPSITFFQAVFMNPPFRTQWWTAATRRVRRKRPMLDCLTATGMRRCVTGLCGQGTCGSLTDSPTKARFRAGPELAGAHRRAETKAAGGEETRRYGRLAGPTPAEISRYRWSVSAEGLMPRTIDKSSRQRRNAFSASAWSPIAASARIRPR